jgi:adenosylmethionine-8-amino-7-oxononanoate aminotransferase
MSYLDDLSRLEKADKDFIWHPFTQMKDWLLEKPVIIAEAQGVFLKDLYGRWFLDGVSSLWVNLHGHRKKEVDDAVSGQLIKVSHSTLLGLSNVPSIKLAERIIGITDRAFPGLHPRLAKVFYSDDGSTAVEVALKMAFQYWLHRNRPEKQTFLSLTHSYHGDTMGSVSLGGIDLFHEVFRPLLFRTLKAPAPYCYRCVVGEAYPECSMACLGDMGDTLEAHASEIAAVVIEPLVQAAGGIIVHPPGYVSGVRELCNRYGVLMIADEVATGFGRTGEIFACVHEGVVPDILCLSKGITNGYMPLAVTLATEEIFNAFLGEFKDRKTFFHGHSYTGNPLACSAALASLDLFETEGTISAVQAKASTMKRELEKIAALAHVGEVRCRGLVAGIELVKDKPSKEPYPWEDKIGWAVAYKAREKGVILRPLGNVVVLMPPLSITEQHLCQLLDITKTCIIAVTGDQGQ